MAKRASDGRFAPRSGQSLLPKKKDARDENGRYLRKKDIPQSKPYSKAVRELLEAKEGGMPEAWDRLNLTEAQALAMVHISQAKSGNHQIGMMLVDRAEGKVPMAVEDREAAVESGAGVKLLADLLGIQMADVIDAEVECIESESPQLELPSSSESLSESSTPSPTLELQNSEIDPQ